MIDPVLHALPDDFELITLIVIGKPGNPEELSEKHRKTELGKRNRMPLEEVVSRNEFEFQD